MIRYADDIVILCQTQAEAETALAFVREWMKRVDLTLHPEKTRIVDASKREVALSFWDITLKTRKRWPRQKSINKFREKIRQKNKEGQRELSESDRSGDQSHHSWLV